VSVLTRYLAAALLRGWLTTLLVIAAIFGLLGFIGELDAAVGDYRAPAIALYTVMVLPQQLMGLAPVIMLLGTIIALASLQRGSELTVISCAGVPPRQLLAAIAVPTVALMAWLWIAMEYVTPQLHQRAEELRLELRHENARQLPRGGLWSKSERRYIHLGAMTEAGQPAQIDLYHFDTRGQLQRAVHAESARVGDDRTWEFLDAQEKRLVEGTLQTQREESLRIDNLWAARELPVLSLSQESMRLSVLLSYGSYLADNARDARQYLSSFWQRLTLPLTVAAMVLLATPIAAGVGSSRGGSVGASLALGAAIGIGFYLGSQILFALGQLFALSQPLVALSPTLIIAASAWLLFRRMHW
jgi:lipopolysaccharide export system permease protein